VPANVQRVDRRGRLIDEGSKNLRARRGVERRLTGDPLARIGVRCHPLLAGAELEAQIAVSDRGTLRGLTQFLRRSVSACPQTPECKSHRGTALFEGGFCDRLFQAARKPLILNGEMSEWLRSTLGNRFRPRALTHIDTHQRTAGQRLPATTVCIRVSPPITMCNLGSPDRLTQF
jgi:hypothetical protein